MNTLKIEDKKEIDNLYLLILNSQLGKGGFGKIFLGRNKITNEEVAVKVENLDGNAHLPREYNIMTSLQGGEGIPKVYKLIQKRHNNYLIMELLGKNLNNLLLLCEKLSIKTVCQIAIQMIKRVEFMHSKGFIHRDIKPSNFLLGKNEKKSTIFIIDFGLSKRYIDKYTGEHIPYIDGKGMTGTSRYMSIFTHLGMEQSRRDDIEGIAYNLIYLNKGKLPWQGTKGKNKAEKYKKILELKEFYQPKVLCDGLPDEFVYLFDYARNLTFEEEPNYKKLYTIFEDLIKRNGWSLDNVFDWDEIDLNKKEQELNLKKLKKQQNENNFKYKDENS